MSADQDAVYLTHILECIANIQELTANGRDAFEAVKHSRAAVLYYLQTMAESTQRLSDALKDTHPEVDWIAISGFRNRLVHGYLAVNFDIVWNVIEQYLPGLRQAASDLLESLDTSDD